MRIFPHFNKEGPMCPICKTFDDKPCTLIPIRSTLKGHIMQAHAVHLDCLDLEYHSIGKDKIICQVVISDKKS